MQRCAYVRTEKQQQQPRIRQCEGSGLLPCCYVEGTRSTYRKAASCIADTAELGSNLRRIPRDSGGSWEFIYPRIMTASRFRQTKRSSHRITRRGSRAQMDWTSYKSTTVPTRRGTNAGVEKYAGSGLSRYRGGYPLALRLQVVTGLAVPRGYQLQCACLYHRSRLPALQARASATKARVMLMRLTGRKVAIRCDILVLVAYGPRSGRSWF
jgi:hypothetical protein